MQYDHSLKSVSDITARLRNMERQKFSQADIQAERDLLFEKCFGINRSELVAPIPRTEIERLKTLCYLDIEEIAERNGFNIEPGNDEFEFELIDNVKDGGEGYRIGRDDRVCLKYLDDDDGEDNEPDDEEDDEDNYLYDEV